MCKGKGSAKWSFNQGNLLYNVEPEKLNTLNLIISNARGSNTGYYECKSQNEFGIPFKSRSYVVVYGKWLKVKSYSSCFDIGSMRVPFL